MSKTREITQQVRGRDCQKLADLSGEYWSGESGNSWNERTLQVLVEKRHDCEMQAVM